MGVDATAVPATEGEFAAQVPLVELRDLTVRFKARGSAFARKVPLITAVDGVSLAVEQGQTLGIVGETGSGKSTIAHVIMGMVPASSGSVLIRGSDDLKAARGVVQVVLQDPYSSLNPRMKVRDIIAEPLMSRHMSRDTVRSRVIEMLQLVGMPANKAELYPHQFSGGQRQRIAIARALAPEPEIIVLDEPTSALDVSVRAQILNLLKSLQDRLGVAYLIISHDLITVAYLSSTVAVMHLGRVVEIGPTESLFEAPRHPYTRELLASVPKSGGTFLLETMTSRSVPVVGVGCKYAPRCPLRAALGDPVECETVDPALRSVSALHEAACHFADEPPEASEARLIP